MQYSEKDLPIQLHHGETLSMSDGTTIRFESNGEAKDIMVNDGFAPAVSLFPGNDYDLDCCGRMMRCSALFEDCLEVKWI